MYHAGSYAFGQSFIHRLDPRVKLAAVVGLSVLLLWIAEPLSLFLGAALLVLARLGGIKIKTVAEAVRPLLFFILLIFAVHLLFHESGDAVIRLPYVGIPLSVSGAQKAFFVTWRFVSLLVAALLLTMTTPPSHLIAAVKWFLRPLKKLRLPVDDIAVMLTLALRLLPVLLREKERAEMAQKARGGPSDGVGFTGRLKIFMSLTLSVLLGVFRRADDLAAAMEARNYRRGGRSSFVELSMKSSDEIALLVIFTLTLFLLVINSRFG